MDKRPIRSGKTSRVLNSTCTGRPASSVTQSAVKDVRVRKTTVRGPNLTFAEQTFAAPASPTGAEKDCEMKLQYNKLLQSIFMDCMLDETEAQEKTELDGMLAQLAERCEQNVDLLDKTHKRLNEISFLSEKQRIIEMKNTDSGQFFDQLEKSKAEQILADLTRKQNAYLNQVETKNVDLGYNQQFGHQQLLDAMQDVLQGLDSIKSQSKLTPEILEHYMKLDRGCGKVETQMKELDDLKKEFEAKFPSLSERAVVKCSEQLEKLFEEQLGLSESGE